MTGHICIIFTMTILGVRIFHYYSSNNITSNLHSVYMCEKLLSAVSGARTCVSRVRSTAECRCLFSRTDMQL